MARSRAGVLLGLWIGTALFLPSNAYAQRSAAQPHAADSSSVAPSERDRDLDLIPVARLGFGTARQLKPDGTRGFAFDLLAGTRLLLGDDETWRPVVSAELGYSRRAGGFGTHDLTLGLGVGVLDAPFGAHLYETLVIGTDGDLGLRTTLRLETLYGVFYLDFGHEVTFVAGGRRHDLRGVIGVDLALVAAAFTMGALLNAL